MGILKISWNMVKESKSLQMAINMLDNINRENLMVLGNIFGSTGTFIKVNLLRGQDKVKAS